MNVLLLGREWPRIQAAIRAAGDDVRWTSEKITSRHELVQWADFLVSFGYRFIIRQKVLDLFPGRAINLHIAYLPWCRGSYPNLWSFIYDTPKGVTIHFLDKGVDTGDIIVQRQVAARADDTLRTSHDRLIDNLIELFEENWAQIRDGRISGTPQPDGFPTHSQKDRERFEHLLVQEWDTPISGLVGAGLKGESRPTDPAPPKDTMLSAESSDEERHHG